MQLDAVTADGDVISEGDILESSNRNASGLMGQPTSDCGHSLVRIGAVRTQVRTQTATNEKTILEANATS